MNSIPPPTPKSKLRKPQSESKLRKPEVPKWPQIGKRFKEIQEEAARKKAAEEEKKKHENPCNKYWVEKAKHAPFWVPPPLETKAVNNYCETVSKDYKCLPTMNYPDGNMGVEYPLGVCQIPPPPPPPVFEERNVSSVDYRGGGVKKSKKRRKSRKTKKKKHRRRTRRRRTCRRRTRRRKRR